MIKYSKTYSAAEVIEKCLITDYLGIQIGQKIISPLRDERTPSFHVFLHRTHGTQVWSDNGTGEFGDIIQLHQRLTRQTNFNAACDELMALNHNVPAYEVSFGSPTKKAPSSQSKPLLEYGIPSATPIEQSRYIRYTGLPVPKWISGALKMFVDTHGNLFTPNTVGGLHVKGGKLRDQDKTFCLNVGNAGISVIGNSAAEIWFVVEGVGDLLALIDGAVGPKHTAEHGYGYVILNSTGNAIKCLPEIKELIPSTAEAVYCYLDIDDLAPGKIPVANRATAAILTAFPQGIDCRDAIQHGKDLRDQWSVVR